MILVTTSDYFPSLGGLTTFANNIVQVLVNLGIKFDLFHWKNINDIQNYPWEDLNRYQLIINIHPMFCWLAPEGHSKMVNFIHGSEILMTSPNLVKKIYKNWMKKKYFKKMELAKNNIFISAATQEKTQKKGFTLNYSRDFIFHNCIDVKDAQKFVKSLNEEIIFSCIVRNVPHKNLIGSLELCEELQKMTKKKIKLVIPRNQKITSKIINIECLEDESNELRDKAYQSSHFNLLLSLDHSEKGFFEGFGLTILEAGKFGTPSIVMNTGGLPEAVHDNITGFVIAGTSKKDVAQLNTILQRVNYSEIQDAVYEHTVTHHGLNQYQKLLSRIISQDGSV